MHRFLPKRNRIIYCFLLHAKRFHCLSFQRNGYIDWLTCEIMAIGEEKFRFRMRTIKSDE